MMHVETIKQKAHALFDTAAFLAHIHNQDEYEEALTLMDNVIEDYETNHALIEALSVSIERWEDSAGEFSEFNTRIAHLDSDKAVLKVIMEQYGLGVADFPEIGSKSLVSKIINHQRQLTKEHITALSKRFNINPALFFEGDL